jgi:HNH endonuclease
VSDKFWAKVQRGAPDECWPWMGFRKPDGHGLTSYKSLPTHASRKAWILVNGYPPRKLCVLHRCDNAACCNPAHMYLGTRMDNMHDRFDNRPPGERAARGRPFMLDDAELERLWQMRRAGATLRECAETFGVHIATICRYVTAVRRRKLEANRAAKLSATRA